MVDEEVFPQPGFEDPHVQLVLGVRAGQPQDLGAGGDGVGRAVAVGVGVQGAEQQAPAGLEAGGQGGQQAVWVQEGNAADGVDQVVGGGFLQVGDGVGTHQVQAGGVGVAVECALVLGGGGVDGGDVGAEAGETGGVPGGSGPEVQDAQTGYLAEDVDARAGLRNIPGPFVQLGQVEGPADLVAAVEGPDLGDVLLDVQHEVLPFRSREWWSWAQDGR